MKTQLPNENQSKPLVSVTVTTYQHAPYIKDCLDGILAQKANFPFEIIIGEDESTDGTREICIEYAKKHPGKIRLFLRSRKDVIYTNGCATGRYNFMQNVREARGEYIAICPGDDYWIDPYKLEIQLCEMKRHPECDMSFHPALAKYVDGRRPDKVIKRQNKGNRVFTASEVIVGRGFCPTAAMVMKKEVIDFLPEWYYTKAPVGDIYLEILGSLNGGLLYIDRVMAVRRENVPGSWGFRRKTESNGECLGRVQLHEECYQLMNENAGEKYTKEINERMGTLNYILAIKFLKSREYSEFRKFIEKSWKLCPHVSFKQTTLFVCRRMRPLLRIIRLAKSDLRKNCGLENIQ